MSNFFDIVTQKVNGYSLGYFLVCTLGAVMIFMLSALLQHVGIEETLFLGYGLPGFVGTIAAVAAIRGAEILVRFIVSSKITESDLEQVVIA